jgi:uncharacterized membrane protein YvbJ
MNDQIKDKRIGKYCQNCGALIDEKAIICPKCGAMVNSFTQKVNKNKKASSKAIISLVLGILSLSCGWFWGSGLVFAITAITLGILDLKSISKRKSSSIDKGLDIAGIVCGGLSILSFFIFIIFIFGITSEY